MRGVMSRIRSATLLVTLVLMLASCAAQETTPPWETATPIVPLPTPPLGTQADFASLSFQVTPEKVRLGRWLFFEPRLSADGSISCASCHRPENAFSEPTPHSTGIRGQQGNRKSPSFVNGAWPFYPVFFWDGRAASLVEQAKGPMANPIEMGGSHDVIVTTLQGNGGYRKIFRDVFGDEAVTIDRVAEAIAAYETTRLSGNSAWDRWKAGDETAVSDAVKRGDALFFDKAACAQCHVGWNFTDAQFHNLGIGWDAASGSFPDPGRVAISKDPKDTGAFKTPTLRDVSRHAPFMHDGSVATLRDTVEHYNKGGTPNPWLSPRMKPLGLTPQEVDDLVAMMEALDGEGYQDQAPTAFPQ
jgi:cytochrome c peroxidase